MKDPGENLVPRLAQETRTEFPNLDLSRNYLEDIVRAWIIQIEHSVNQILISNQEYGKLTSFYKNDLFYLMVKIKVFQALSGMEKTIDQCKKCAKRLLSSMDISDKIKNSILEIIGIQTTRANTASICDSH